MGEDSDLENEKAEAGREKIIEAIVRVAKAAEDPRGVLWMVVLDKVQGELGVEVARINTAILEAVDRGLITDDQVGWLKTR